MSEKYNGWTNYETWLFNLWYGDYYTNYVYDNTVTAPEEFAEVMKAQMTDFWEEFEVEDCFFNDAISGVIREVNFYEVAKSIMDEVLL